MTKIAAERVLVLDFGSQYAQLIARRVRQQQVYCEIVRHDITAKRIEQLAPKGLILSGGPSSVYESGAPKCDPQIFHLGLPMLGICYGMQLACEALGGRVESAPAREYGRAQCRLVNDARVTAALVRGRDEYGHFDPEPRPAGDFDAASRAAHAAAVERFFESNKLLAARRRSGNVGI